MVSSSTESSTNPYQVKSTQAASSSSYMWGYLISGSIIAGLSAYYDNIDMMLVAFVVVCGFRIYEERYQSAWIPHWRSIFEKYERAAMSADQLNARAEAQDQQR